MLAIAAHLSLSVPIRPYLVVRFQGLIADAVGEDTTSNQKRTIKSKRNAPLGRGR